MHIKDISNWSSEEKERFTKLKIFTCVYGSTFEKALENAYCDCIELSKIKKAIKSWIEVKIEPDGC